MKRISDEKFLEVKPDPDKVIAIKIMNGEFYFLAWMENAPHYKIQQAMKPEGYLLCREDLIFDGDIMESVQNTDEYNTMNILYELDDEGNLVNEEEKQFENEYEKFLSIIKPYERDGVSDPDDHDILMLTKEELSSFCDLLRDGEYILIMTEDIVV